MIWNPRPRTLLAAGAMLALIGGPGALLAVEAAPSIGGCPVFPANNVWNTDITNLPVHPSSATWIGNMGGTSRLLHPDFGPSGGFPYGIPFNVVAGSHQKVNLTFDYSPESDHVPYPFGPDISIEGGSGAGGDRHAIMIDSSTCTLFELYNAQYNGAGNSTAGSGATWNLARNGLRPATWTSADAAGLPIFPGLLRLEEVQAGSVQHAIRFTAQRTDRRFIWPARHQAGAASDPSLPPMGARFRLRPGFNISRYSAPTRVVLTAMQRYGLILADNGSNWYFQGAAQDGWRDTMISELKTIPAGQFDAIDESALMIDANSAQARGAVVVRSPVAPARPAPVVVAAPPVVAPAPTATVDVNSSQWDLPRRRYGGGGMTLARLPAPRAPPPGTPLAVAAVAAALLLGLLVAAWLLRHLLLPSGANGQFNTEAPSRR